jgi:Dolichyl-phosphate-mannose-protein mannosyltransferase
LTSSDDVAVRSSLARTRTWLAAVPAWLWLGALILVSAGIRLALAKPHPAPWVFPDELIYANLAESFAETGRFALRESPGLQGYGPGYPLLIAPAYFVFDSLAHAYAAAKAINAFVMSLAAIPVYLIARRLVPVWLALLAATLALAIPSFLYTGTILTENAFYPAFAAAAFGMFAALERPTHWRQLGALALIGVAFLIRAQAVSLGAAFLTAIVLVCLVEARADGRLNLREVARRLDAFRLTWILSGVGLLLVFGAAFVRGRSPSSVFGAYSVLADANYAPSEVARWIVYHLAEIDLYLGILPMAALIVLVFEAFGRGALPRPLRLFGLLAVSIVIWMTLVVSATMSHLAAGGTGRIEERYLFHTAPLFLIALVVWVARGLPRVWPAAAVAALLAGGLPGAIPYDLFANLGALSDTLTLIPLWNIVFFGHIQAATLPALVVGCSLAAAALFLFLPARVALLPIALVLSWFILIQVSVERQMKATSEGVLQQGLSVRREWIDEKVGGNARVAALWTGNGNPMTMSQNAFFNRSVHPVFFVDGAAPVTGLVPQLPASVDPATGDVRAADGKTVRADYALAEPQVALSGEEVARDPTTGLVLYRMPSDQVRVRARTAGVYPDSWTGPEASYTLWRCLGGQLTVDIASQADLFTTPQTVTAVSGQRSIGRLRIRPGQEKTLTVPVRPEGGHCAVTLRVTPTAVPAQVLGTPDTRSLGVRVTRFDYRPDG